MKLKRKKNVKNRGDIIMPKGKRRKVCLKTKKKPDFPRKHKNWDK